MQPTPDFTYFAHVKGQPFALQLADGTLEVPLHDVRPGVAMSARHECFSLLFLLPAGLALPQALYRLIGPSGECWTLLLVPVGPDAEGRQRLEAVFHREKAQ